MSTGCLRASRRRALRGVRRLRGVGRSDRRPGFRRPRRRRLVGLSQTSVGRLASLFVLGLGPHAGRQLGLLGPGPGPLAVLGLAGDLAILEIAHLLRADLAVLRIGIAGLAAHGPRQLAAALVGPGPLAAAAAAGALDVSQGLVDPDAALAHPVRRLGRRLAGDAGIQLIAAIPDPGLLAARRAAADLAIGDGPEVGLARLAHPPRRIVGEAAGVRLDLLVGAPAPLLLAAVDAAVDGAVLQLAVDALALHAAERRRLELGLGRAGQELRPLGEDGRARAARDDAGELLVLQRGQLPFATGAHPARRLPIGGERLQLILGAPGPGAVAARPVAGALRVRDARELLAAGIAHRRGGIRRIGRAAAAELGALAPGDRDPGARAPMNGTRGRLGPQSISKRESGETHDEGAYADQTPEGVQGEIACRRHLCSAFLGCAPGLRQGEGEGRQGAFPCRSRLKTCRR